MRAHEKMLLNSTLMMSAPYGRHYGEFAGCALGMMEGPKVVFRDDRWETAEVLYPWLLSPVKQPCDCQIEWQYISGSCVATGLHATTHLFNQHVCGGFAHNHNPWTIEQLADYLKSIDPTVDQDEELICEETDVNQEKINT